MIVNTFIDPRYGKDVYCKVCEKLIEPSEKAIYNQDDGIKHVECASDKERKNAVTPE